MTSYNYRQERKDEGTLSVPASGFTKQGGINSQGDTKLRLERRTSLPVDNHPADMIEIELGEGLEEAFQRQHPRLYHWLNTKLGQKYQRMRL